MCEIENTFSFCPMCQLPLKAINILPDLHVSQCINISEDSSREECPRGVHCLSTDLFHYRDFSHKLLAAYRSSADFVPPDIDIQPSPKKRKITPTRSQRKQKSPSKVNIVNKIMVSESDSDGETLIPQKRPCRKLSFNEKTQCFKTEFQNSSAQTKTSLAEEKQNLNSTNNTIRKYSKTRKINQPCKSNSECNTVEESSETESNQPIKKINVTKSIDFKKCFERKSGELKKNPDLNQLISLKGSNKTYSSENLSQDSSIHNQKNGKNNWAIANIELNSKEKCCIKEEFLFTQDQILLNNNNLNSTEKEISSIPRPETPHSNKSSLSDMDSPKASDIDYLKSDSDVMSEISKTPVCVITRLELGGFPFGALADKSKQSKVNKSNYEDDFDDIIPRSKLDKKLLKTLERKKSKSPTSTLDSCSSKYNGSASVTSGTLGSSGGEEDEEVKDYDVPSSPEVVIPLQTSKKTNLFLSSSSDSDLPLASLVIDKINKKGSDFTDITRNRKSRGVLRTLKKSPVLTNLLHSDSDVNTATDKDSDSGKSTGSKSSINSILKGKVIAGKILRTPKKTPIYLNVQLLQTKINGFSDKESDSGKSSGSKDSSSFIPSEKETSSQHTDSAFSAESSDNLVSTASSTFTSSEDYSSGSRSTDPSFIGESDSSLGTTVSKIRKTKERRSPQQCKYGSKTLSEDGGSSDISQKEKMLFGRSKKSSSVKIDTSSIPIQPMDNIYITCQNKAKKEWRSVLSNMKSSCFPSDLKIDSEDSLTVASSCSSSDTSRSSITLPTRQCPFYKRIPDTPFAVDAFQYWNIPGVRIYFLSHFHSDHYIGLKKSFANPIYCSQITANLVRMQLRVEEKWLRILELNEPQVICGVEVTALDANHCPGSMMFLFALNNGQNYLHVGDFRASKSMKNYPPLQRITISKLFLDTTYCSPQYCFPTQEEVINKVIDIVREQVKTKPRTLVVCGSYTIGKEKVFLGVAEALNWQVWARPNKRRVFACLNDKRINSRLSQDPRTANVHVLPMANIQMTPLQQHLNSCSGTFTHVLGFKPTGWELNGKTQDFKVTTRDNITIYGVPYSEHSSFTELRDFVCFLEPREVVPTVNVGSAASRSKMSKHFSDWLKPQVSERQPAKAQTKVSQYFTKASVS